MPGRNPYFTGRDKQLAKIRAAFVAGESVAVTQAIRGLGGIGKTSLVVEYAYVYANEYTKQLFCRADSESALATGFLTLTGELGLPLPEEKPEYARQAVLGWLAKNPGWLLIVDNVDFSGTLTPEALRTWLPPDPKGHILLTSRTNEGFGKLHVRRTFPLEKMPIEEATPFLIERVERVTGENVPPADQRFAFELAQELDGLPLALEQAAAYIGNQGHAFERYLREFKERFEHIEKAGPESEDYPYTVATTWEMNFQAVEKESPAAAEILRYSAFLSPDAIPGEIFIDGASQLGGLLSEHFQFQSDSAEDWRFDRWEDALKPLEKFALVSLSRESMTHNVHRMVRAVVYQRIEIDKKNDFQARLLAAIDNLFPSPKDFRHWGKCQRLLSSVLSIVDCLGKANTDTKVRLLDRVGALLMFYGRYNESENSYRRALAIRESNLPDGKMEIAESLLRVASSLWFMERYDEVESLCRRSVTIFESVSEVSSEIARALVALAQTLDSLDRDDEAELFYRRALSIIESLPPNEQIESSDIINNIGALLRKKGYINESESLCRWAIEMGESLYPEGDLRIVKMLNNLAELLYCSGRYSEAEPLYRRAIEIQDSLFPEGHPDTAGGLNNLALILVKTGRYDEAEPLYRRSLAIFQSFNEEKKDSLKSLNNLAGFLKQTGRHDEAESLYRRALTIRESSRPVGHPDIADACYNLATLLIEMGRYAEAGTLFFSAIQIQVVVLGWKHPDTKRSVDKYLLTKLIGLGKITDLGENIADYINEHPDEVWGLLHDVLVLQSDVVEA